MIEDFIAVVPFIIVAGIIAGLIYFCNSNEEADARQCQSYGGVYHEFGRSMICVKDGLILDMHNGKPMRDGID